MSLILSSFIIVTVAVPMLYRGYKVLGMAATAVVCISIPFNMVCLKILLDILMRVLENPVHGADGILMEFFQRLQSGGWIWFAGMVVCHLLFRFFVRINDEPSEEIAEIP